MHRSSLAIALVRLTGTVAMRQDPVKVDPNHSYGPHEKSVMHSHPDAVAIYLTDVHVKMTTPDGKSQEETGKAGQAQWTPAGTHLPLTHRGRCRAHEPRCDRTVLSQLCRLGSRDRDRSDRCRHT